MKKDARFWRRVVTVGRICLYIPAITLLILTGLFRFNVIKISGPTSDGNPSSMAVFLDVFRIAALTLMMTGMVVSLLGRMGFQRFLCRQRLESDDEEEDDEEEDCDRT